MDDMNNGMIYLASQSPRRAELLRQIAQPFTVLPVDIDETVWPQETPHDYVARLALAKARAAWALPLRNVDMPVLCADTTVAVDGLILGKPGNAAEFMAMMHNLGGREHKVYTAVCLKFGEHELCEVDSTKVWMRAMSADELAADWASGEPRDKAGGYAIQGRAARYISRIEGSYATVVGLPVHIVERMIRELSWAGAR